MSDKLKTQESFIVTTEMIEAGKSAFFENYAVFSDVIIDELPNALLEVYYRMLSAAEKQTIGVALDHERLQQKY